MRMKCHQDEGIGLAEVLVAMLLLAILALSLLPTLIAGMKIATTNTTVAAATQFANDQVKIAQSKGPACAAVAGVAGTSTSTDARGVKLTATTTVTGTCPLPANTAGTMRVSTVVTRFDNGATLATASTLVLVTP